MSEKMRVRIEPMTAEHLDEVAEMERLCFTDPWSRNLLAEALKNDLSAYLVALDDAGRVAGYAGLTVVLDEGSIDNIAVRPEYRRRGVAAQLLQVFLNFAQGNRLAFLTLEDFTRDIEVIVVPNVYYDATELLTEDRPLVVQGRVDISDSGVKILADKIWPMEGYRTEYFIVTTSALATAENLKRLRETAKAHSGDHTVHLYISDRRRNTDLGPEFRMDGSPEAAAAVEKIYGAGSVRER